MKKISVMAMQLVLVYSGTQLGQLIWKRKKGRTPTAPWASLTSFTPFCRSRSTGLVGWLEADWWARKNQARIPLDRREECGQIEPKRSSPCLLTPRSWRRSSPHQTSISIPIGNHKSDYQWLVEKKLLGHHRSRTKVSSALWHFALLLGDW